MDGACKVLAEYVWLGCSGALRSKTRVLDELPTTVDELPAMVVQPDETAELGAGDIVLKPRKLFRDPFRGGDHLLVLCDTWGVPAEHSAFPAPATPLQPHPANARVGCEEVMAAAEAGGHSPLLAAEQEYFVEDEDAMPSLAGPYLPTTLNMGGVHQEATGAWPHAHLPDPTKPTLFGPKGELTQLMLPASARSAAIARAAAARRLSEAHLQACIHAGLKLSGTCEGDRPGVWSYKLGPLPGTDLGDQVWVSRHLLIRLSEAMGIPLSFNPTASPAARRQTLLGCHIKLSTAASRQPGTGTAILQQYLGRLQATQLDCWAASNATDAPGGSGSDGDLPFASVGGRAAPLVLPLSSMLRGAGHFVDRRGAANADPYMLVTRLTASTLGLRSPASAAPAAAYASPSPCTAAFQQQQQAVAVAQLAAAVMQVATQQQERAATLQYQGYAAAAPCKFNDAHAPLVGSAHSGASRLVWDEGSETGRPGCAGEQEVDCGTSLCTEDVLIEELERMEGEGCGDELLMTGAFSGMDEGCESCCSDGTSPESADLSDDAQSHGQSPTTAPCPLTGDARYAKKQRGGVMGCSPGVSSGLPGVQG